jgi:cytochrome oxidase assembly protein ShyY1
MSRQCSLSIAQKLDLCCLRNDEGSGGCMSQDCQMSLRTRCWCARTAVTNVTPGVVYTYCHWDQLEVRETGVPLRSSTTFLLRACHKRDAITWYPAPIQLLGVYARQFC